MAAQRLARASGGVEAARAVLPGTLLELYFEDYPTWAARRVRNAAGSGRSGARS
jgi:hypothetical protein